MKFGRVIIFIFFCLISFSPSKFVFAEEKFLTLPFNIENPTISCGWGCYKGHKGTDYSIVTGTEILAAFDGLVVKVVNTFKDNEYKKNSYGNYVRVSHANGYDTIYAHLKKDSILVESGDVVERGQKIALSDNSGQSTGPHLHFEVRKDNVQVNPYSSSIWLSDPPTPPDETSIPQEPVEPVGGDDDIINPDDPIWYRARRDATPPVTAVSPADGSFNYFPVGLTLIATDPGGIKETWYKLDAADWTRGNSFSVTGEGEHTLSYYSVDKFNNWEQIRTKTIIINLSAPYTAINLDQEYYNTAPLNVVLTATDAQGILATYARVNGGQFIAQNNFWLDAEGDYLIEYYSEDIFHEQEPIKTRHVVIDTTAPVLSILSPTDSETANFILTYDVGDAAEWQIEYKQGDPPAGGETWTPWIDNTTTIETFYEFTNATRGATYYFHIKGVDSAGNDSGWSEPFAVAIAPITIDPTSYISVNKTQATADGADAITLNVFLYYQNEAEEIVPLTGQAANLSISIANLVASAFTEVDGSPSVYTATITSAVAGTYNLAVSANGTIIDKDNQGQAVAVEFVTINVIEPEAGLVVSYSAVDHELKNHPANPHVDLISDFCLKKEIEVVVPLEEGECWYDNETGEMICGPGTYTYTDYEPQAGRGVTMYIDDSAIENLSDPVIHAITEEYGYADFDFSFDLVAPDMPWPDFQIKLDSTGQILKEGNLRDFTTAGGTPVPV